MKSISVHGIDKETEKAIKERANTEGKSVNKVVKEMIAKSLGLVDQQESKVRKEGFADLCGVWTIEEAEDFLEAIGDLEIVDPKDWR
jgi:plasmid stability protein